MAKPMSTSRFLRLAVTCAAAATLLLFVAGELGGWGLVIVAVAQALVVAALLRACREPLPHTGSHARTTAGGDAGA